MAHRALIPQTSPPPASPDLAWSIIHPRSVGSTGLSVAVFVVVVVFATLAALVILALWIPRLRASYGKARQAKANAEFERQLRLRDSLAPSSLVDKPRATATPPGALGNSYLVDVPDLYLPPAMMYEAPEHNHSSTRYDAYGP